MRNNRRGNSKILQKKIENNPKDSHKRNDSFALEYTLNVLLPDFLIFIFSIFSSIGIMLLLFKYI